MCHVGGNGPDPSESVTETQTEEMSVSMQMNNTNFDGSMGHQVFNNQSYNNVGKINQQNRTMNDVRRNDRNQTFSPGNNTRLDKDRREQL
jgi:hypothetical protein